MKKQESSLFSAPSSTRHARVFLSLLIFLFYLASCTRCSFPTMSPRNGELTILSYNVQNLFDDIDNGIEYIEFDPGAGEWNSDLFFKKLMNIAEVLNASVQGGPDIIALQEVENLNVLETLQETALTGRGYREVVCIPAEDSAVNCGFITRFPVIEVRSHLVALEGSGYNRLILEVEFETGDTPLIIFNNHWKSKSGGVEETELARIECAAFLKERILELTESNHGVDFVILGDLNENVDEYLRVGGAYQTALIPHESQVPEAYTEKSIRVTYSAEETKLTGTDVVLFSPWDQTEKEGSYVYNAVWETIDHVLLPPSLFDDGGWEYTGFDVIDEDFLLTDQNIPKRWNTDLQSGYSDHLPLLLTLTID